MSTCGSRTYSHIDAIKMNTILDKLKIDGAIISGNNPWNVKTNHHGIKLNGNWNENTSVLTVTVTDSAWYAPCETIWSKMDELMGLL